MSFPSGRARAMCPRRRPSAAPAIESLLQGETFYTWQRGIPPLREALARYHARHYGRCFRPENFFVTGGGMQAIQTIIQMIAGEGGRDRAADAGLAQLRRAHAAIGRAARRSPARFRQWPLASRSRPAIGAITTRTKAIVLNSPSNPVGWTASLDDLKAVRDECRKRGLWIVGDEVYARFYYGEAHETRAPSFLDICDSEEQILLANTFSKNWAMTGWRVGWLQAPKALGPAIERIIQYNTSGTAAFLQRGCVAALDGARISSPRKSRRRAPIAISSRLPCANIHKSVSNCPGAPSICFSPSKA